jgi:hypothetical protein
MGRHPKPFTKAAILDTSWNVAKREAMSRAQRYQCAGQHCASDDGL